MGRGLDDVLQHRAVRKQVELLEHHANVGALKCGLVFGNFVQCAVALAVTDQITVHVQPPGGDFLQVVHATKESRLPGAGRPEQAGNVSLGNVQVNTFEYLELAEVFAHLLCINHDV